jgi:hypothetical protein
MQGKIYYIFVLLTVIFSCGRQEDPTPDEEGARYHIGEYEESGVFGNITFRKIDETSTSVTLQMEGTYAGGVHPVRIYDTEPGSGGPAISTLSPVDGGNGLSETRVSELDDGTPANYEYWVDFNGFVVVYNSEEVMEPIAIGIIGDVDPDIPDGY